MIPPNKLLIVRRELSRPPDSIAHAKACLSKMELSEKFVRGFRTFLKVPLSDYLDKAERGD